jgi:hypothetical protein
LSTSVALPRTRGAQPSSVLLDPRRLLRSVYLGRLAIAGAIFLAAVFVWREADRSATLVASLLVTGAMVFTGTSAIFSESRRVPLTRTFLETQALFDLVIVTTIVHITGGDVSQFAALYILLIAFYALLLSAAGGLLVSAAACVLYFGDVILGHEAALNLALWLQLGLFATVAITSGYIAARLREARDVREELTAELERCGCRRRTFSGISAPASSLWIPAERWYTPTQPRSRCSASPSRTVSDRTCCPLSRTSRRRSPVHSNGPRRKGFAPFAPKER